MDAHHPGGILLKAPAFLQGAETRGKLPAAVDLAEHHPGAIILLGMACQRACNPLDRKPGVRRVINLKVNALDVINEKAADTNCPEPVSLLKDL